ncbi:MAG: squalene/phytoene synthase family protein [Actinomycetota bacterium]|nr:squalene/phytoene synthase family protein [Actinomycetota bacterium]
MTVSPPTDRIPNRPPDAGSNWPPGLPSDGEILGRMAGENFPVATALLGSRLRGRLVALYGWARLVDQLGDDYPGDRLAALAWVDAELTRALSDPTDGTVHPLVRRAALLVGDANADPDLLRDLIRANQVDQTAGTYATFGDLVEYCRLSANPVGRLVLAVFDATTPERAAWSDDICTALQIAEHCGDVAEDAAAGRVYLPAEDLDRFEVDPGTLAGPGPASPRLRGLICFEAARARRILIDGQPLVGSLRGRSRLTVAGFVAGGHAALDALADAGFDPLNGAPRPRTRRLLVHTATLLGGALGGGSLPAHSRGPAEGARVQP